MNLWKCALVFGILTASAVATAASAQQNPPAIPPAVPATPVPPSAPTIVYGTLNIGASPSPSLFAAPRRGVGSLDLANAASRAFHGRLTKRTDLTVTASGTTIAFTRPVYVRMSPEQAGAKVIYTIIILRPAVGRDEHRLESASGKMAFLVFNDSEGKDLLLKVRAAGITYSYSRPDLPDKPAGTQNTQKSQDMKESKSPEIFLSNTFTFQSAAEHKLQQEREDWIRKAATDVDGIRVGMTRADLSKVFTTEGGLASRDHRFYIYRDCSLIKIEVRFKPVPELRDDQGRLLGQDAPEDIITEVSRPFLTSYHVID